MVLQGKFSDKSNVYIFKLYFIWPLNRSVLCDSVFKFSADISDF